MNQPLTPYGLNIELDACRNLVDRLSAHLPHAFELAARGELRAAIDIVLYQIQDEPSRYVGFRGIAQIGLDLMRNGNTEAESWMEHAANLADQTLSFMHDEDTEDPVAPTLPNPHLETVRFLAEIGQLVEAQALAEDVFADDVPARIAAWNFIRAGACRSGDFDLARAAGEEMLYLDRLCRDG